MRKTIAEPRKANPAPGPTYAWAGVALRMTEDNTTLEKKDIFKQRLNINK